MERKENRVLATLALTKRRHVPQCELDDLLRRNNVTLTKDLIDKIRIMYPNVEMKVES